VPTATSIDEMITVFGRTQQRLLQRLQHHHRSFSTPRRGEASVKIPAQVFVFSLLMIPVVGFALYAQRYGPEEEELEEEIRKRYAPDIAKSQRNNEAMQELFQHAIKNPDDGAEDDRLSQVLYGGKGEMKRLHAIDKELYGTAQGVEQRNRLQEELKQQAEENKKRRKRRKQKQQQDEVVVNKKKEDEGKSEAAKDETKKRFSSVDATQIATIAAVGTIAAVAGFLAGGRRN